MKRTILLTLIAALSLSLLTVIATSSSARAGGNDQPAIAASSGLCYDPMIGKWVKCSKLGIFYKTKSGEPRMEKVSNFRYVDYGRKAYWNDLCESQGLWVSGHYKWYFCIRTYKLPVGCNFRYQY